MRIFTKDLLINITKFSFLTQNADKAKFVLLFNKTLIILFFTIYNFFVFIKFFNDFIITYKFACF